MSNTARPRAIVYPGYTKRKIGIRSEESRKSVLKQMLIAAIVVFIIYLVGNSIGFGNRFLSALMSAIVFALVFGTLVYFGYGSVSMSVTTTPSTTPPAQTQK